MKFSTYVLAAVAVIALLFVRTKQNVEVVTQEDGSWGYRFLTTLGNPAPSNDMLNFVEAWHRAEGGDNTGRFNPLNTTQDAAGATCFNADPCVKDYPNEETGFNATIETITNGRYEPLVHALRTNDVPLAINALGTSPWGTNASVVSEVWTELPVSVPIESKQVLQGTEREQLIEYAKSLVGIPYVRGGSDAFRSGTLDGSGDCSSTMQHIYNHVLGIDIGTNTFNQYPALRPISFDEIKPGDLWYGQGSSDQHVGMVADIDGDGTWDLLNNGNPSTGFYIDYNFLESGWINDFELIGYARVLGD